MKTINLVAEGFPLGLVCETKTYKSIWVKDVKSCMIRNFFEEQQLKPIHLRQTFCMISCPCENCSPGRL
jgi:hypothetical protein